MGLDVAWAMLCVLWLTIVVFIVWALVSLTGARGR